MAKVRATILMPTTGDRGTILPYSVQSILKQTESSWELFIVGDGVTPETKKTAESIAEEDPRIRFFDFPKDESRGELNRHKLLREEAKGEIVCYICDRDLYLSNHIQVMYALLQDYDIGISLQIRNQSDGLFELHPNGVDLSIPSERQAFLEGKQGMPLSMVAHRMDAYLKLPHGWRKTPKGTATDIYMWRQFLEQEWVRATSVMTPTIVYLKRGNHPGLSTQERTKVSQHFFDLYCQPKGLETFLEHFFKDTMQKEALRYQERLKKQKEKALLKQQKAKEKKRKKGLIKQMKSLLGSIPKEQEVAKKGLDLNRPFPDRKDLKRFQINEDLYVDVYWKALNIGTGPALSFYVCGHELLKFDCFGKFDGHFHVKFVELERPREPRIFFFEDTKEAQIERSFFELSRNLNYYLQRHPDQAVRRMKIDLKTMDTTLSEAKELMYIFLKKEPWPQRKEN